MGGGQERETNTLSAIRAAGQTIAPLHEPIGEPQEGDWLDVHEEPGQSFEEYRRSSPVLPTSKRTTMYLQPLGDFNVPQAAVDEAAAQFLGVFYAVPVRILDRMDMAWVPPQARRLHPFTGDEDLVGLPRRSGGTLPQAG